MARQKKNGNGGKADRQLVPVIYARTITEAEYYKGLLTSNDIPATIEEEAEPGEPAGPAGRGVPVLVPDQLLDEASEILAEHEEAEEDEELNEYEDLDGEDELDEDLEDEELDDDDDLDDDDEDLDDDEDDLDDYDDDLDEDVDDVDDLEDDDLD